MDVKYRKVLLQGITDIVSQEFISENTYAVCLPASMILFDQFKKLGITPNYLSGGHSYENLVTVNLHFWLSVDDEIYDPTTKITWHHLDPSVKQGLDFKKFRYCPGKVIIQRKEERFIFTLASQDSVLLDASSKKYRQL